MYYRWTFNIPAGTQEDNPAILEMPLTNGVIHQVIIDYPSGPRGTVFVSIMRENRQIYPTNPREQFNTDNRAITFPDFYELRSQPYILQAVGWSPNASYPHAIGIEIGLIESKVALTFLNILGGMQKLLSLMGIRV
jgi:hypothetical protein